MELPLQEADAIATAVRNADAKLLELEDRVRQRAEQLDSRSKEEEGDHWTRVNNGGRAIKKIGKRVF
jgi:hypothetical protein